MEKGKGRETEEGATPKENKALTQRMTREDLYLPCLCFSSFPLPGAWKVLERREEMAFENWDLHVSPVLRYEHLSCGLRKGQAGRIRRCRRHLN